MGNTQAHVAAKGLKNQVKEERELYELVKFKLKDGDGKLIDEMKLANQNKTHGNLENTIREHVKEYLYSSDNTNDQWKHTKHMDLREFIHYREQNCEGEYKEWQLLNDDLKEGSKHDISIL